jgi:hypothetical protein
MMQRKRVHVAHFTVERRLAIGLWGARTAGPG